MELIQALQDQILSLLSSVVLVCVSVITTYVTKWLKQKGIIARLEAKKNIVGIVVHAVEQIFEETNGELKYKTAKEQIVKMLNEKKIKVSEEELDLLIEACVKEMKNSVKEVTNK